MEIPTGLKHKPIIGVDYSGKDEYASDARYLSIGEAQWDNDDISAKIFRWSGDRWSRQSEEMPLWRVLDLATLVVGTITGQSTSLEEECVDAEKKVFLENFINDNIDLYSSRIQELRSLLNLQPAQKSEKVPNIFSFATSELSQDAIIAWLISWADDEYGRVDDSLCQLGKSIISILSGISKDEIQTVEVGRQWQNIDIWIKINDDKFVVVEDKIGTSIHDNQLERYRKIAEDYYQNRKIFLAYVKTENEPNSICHEIEDVGYKITNRTALLEVLNEYRGSNSIVIDYRRHLQSLEDSFNSYKVKSVNDWACHEWQGFYTELEKHIQVESWSYVSNPSGGFLGLWWHFVKNEEIRMYLQFEEKKLCFKIEYEGEVGQRSSIRQKYYEKLSKLSKKKNISIERPARFGSGVYMTIGVVSQGIFGDGLIDINSIVPILKDYEALIDEVMNVL